MKKVTKDKYIKYFYALLFIMILAIAYFFPYAHDDWPWATTEGFERLKSGFQDYNGRWAGNIFVMFLTKFRVPRALIIAIILFFIVYLGRKLIGKKDSITMLFIVLLLGIPTGILAEGVAWTSGFANYVPPVLLTLILLYVNRNIFSEREVNINGFLPSIALLIIGFLNSLFIEHMTIYNIVLSISIIIWIFIKEHKIIKADIMWMIGAIMGAVLMFSNSAYGLIFAKKDFYRSIAQDNILLGALHKYFDKLQNYLVWNNVLLNIILCIILLMIVYHFRKDNKNKLSKIKNLLLECSTIFITMFMGYIIYSRIIGTSLVFIYPSYKKYIEGVAVILFAVAIITTIIITIQNKFHKKRLLFWVISIVVIASPLLIVDPIGYRCFFPTYVMFILLCCDLAYTIVTDELFLKRILMLISITLCGSLFIIYGYIYKVDNERYNYIMNNLDKEVLILPKMPFQQYLHVPNPYTKEFIPGFKEFYGIDKKTEIKIIEYKKWKANYYK